MRAIFDTNIFISFLLSSPEKETIAKIIEAAVKGRFTIILTDDIVKEFSKTIARKKYLSQRITQEEADQFIDKISMISNIIAPISGKLPKITRDQKDDYLIAYAVVGQADYLVTGDKDLLVLKKIDRTKIITPKKFLKVLKQKTHDLY